MDHLFPATGIIVDVSTPSDIRNSKELSKIHHLDCLVDDDIVGVNYALKRLTSKEIEYIVNKEEINDRISKITTAYTF